MYIRAHSRGKCTKTLEKLITGVSSRFRESKHVSETLVSQFPLSYALQANSDLPPPPSDGRQLHFPPDPQPSFTFPSPNKPHDQSTA